MRRRSLRISLRDIRTIGETVHECREMWADPLAWQTHLLRRAALLGGCRVGLYFEMADSAGSFANKLLAAHDTGWETANERETVVDGLANQPLRYSPLWASFADMLSVRGRRPGAIVAHQNRVIATPTWQSSEMYDRHVRPTRLGEAMLSAVWMPHLSAWSAFSLVTDRSEPTQTPRHLRLVRLLHQQVAPLIGVRLSTYRDRTTSPLSSTRRRVLDLLLDGLSEPDIARSSYRSRSAIHEHVTAIYRHFGVCSRAELATFFLRRRPVAAEPAGDSSPLDHWLDRPWAA